MIKIKAFHILKQLHCHIVRGRGSGNVGSKGSGSMIIDGHDSGRNGCLVTRRKNHPELGLGVIVAVSDYNVIFCCWLLPCFVYVTS